MCSPKVACLCQGSIPPGTKSIIHVDTDMYRPLVLQMLLLLQALPPATAVTLTTGEHLTGTPLMMLYSPDSSSQEFYTLQHFPPLCSAPQLLETAYLSASPMLMCGQPVANTRALCMCGLCNASS